MKMPRGSRDRPFGKTAASRAMSGNELNKMALGRTACLVLLVSTSSGIRTACAMECLISGPRYQLKSDIVDWSMKIRDGQSCIRGVRFNNVAFTTLKLITPPQFGKVTLLGPGFSYTAMSDFEGVDSFAVEVTGAINRIVGASTIRIAVSIGSSHVLTPAASTLNGVPPTPAAPPASATRTD